MIEAFIHYCTDLFWVFVTLPVTVGEKFFVVNLVTFAGLAYLSFRLYETRRHRSFLKFLFPKKIYLHPSARIDYGIFLVNLATSPFLLVTAALQTATSIYIGRTLIGWNDGSAIVQGNWTPLVYGFFILGYTLVADLSVYLVHRLHHQVDWLWPIHKLHHSAEVMTPVTLFRKHPVWNLTARALNLVLTGLFQGIFVFFFYGGPAVEILFGLNTIYIVYNFFGANLRHSHVWLSWGKPLSYLFISPAMHQIHHDPNRDRKNYGEVFAIWDWMFGTLYIPRKREHFAIGLGEPEAQPYGTLLRAYYMPLVEVWQVVMVKFKTRFS